MNRASLFATLFTVMTVPAQTPLPRTLLAMREHYRPLLLFTGGQARLADQQLTNLAEHAAEFRERQMLVVGVEGTDPNLPSVLLSPSEDEHARRRFHVPPGEFAVILIGKDGAEKLRSRVPLSWEKLRNAVDAMPMRQQELHGH